MARSNQVGPKKTRGRPATGRDPVTAIRLSAELRATVDKWAAKQDDEPGRSEAIRRLVELGLTVKTAAATRAARAVELAAKAIEKMSDHTATADERVQRRRRLTKGPSEFREDRLDLPKAKGSPK
jgi:hypothetical protein